jgi:DNA (cytosine-5)-methyltransferase 1
MMNQLTHLDLFSGIGGFAYAAKEVGLETIGFSEIDPFCCKVLKKHWPDVPNYGDIKSLNFHGHVDVITGGFPCQPFSIAGKKKGKDDNRYLWPEFLRIIKQSNPTWIIAENVTGIVGMELDNIIDDLEAENYETQAFIIPACASNAPHRRDRVWIVANRISERCDNSGDNRQTRYLQGNKEWNLAQIQQEWEQFKPITWATNKAEDWLQFNARISRSNDGLPKGLDRIKSLGNSIVPQIAFVILSTIFNICRR